MDDILELFTKQVEPNPRGAGLTELELAIALPAFKATKTGLELRASKPAKASGPSQYVWRMIVFACPKASQHRCMPIGADFDVRDSDIPSDFLPTVNQEWLAKENARAKEEESRDPTLFQRLTTYPFHTSRDGSPPLDWTEYHMRRWPRERRSAYLRYLDTIADRVVATVPVRKQRGTMAWMRALHG